MKYEVRLFHLILPLLPLLYYYYSIMPLNAPNYISIENIFLYIFAAFLVPILGKVIKCVYISYIIILYFS